MKNKTLGMILLVCFFSAAFFGCVTNTMVTIESNVVGADLYIDGIPSGQTPATVEVSNAIWEDPDIRLEKEGYKIAYSDFKRTMQPFNIVTGIFLWVPWLWASAPEAYQYVKMYPESE